MTPRSLVILVRHPESMNKLFKEGSLASTSELYFCAFLAEVTLCVETHPFNTNSKCHFHHLVFSLSISVDWETLQPSLPQHLHVHGHVLPSQIMIKFFNDTAQGSSWKRNVEILIL